ncbi:tRNA (N6-threonylcarbamoyladenosine(37)-N6)-methyltransferase TrmO [Acetanaerobacterium elongatum]|uniref:tRNA-Thr(GGU) m(6)t(6)A37 methyltransferase TsaA n=1 Tax=Acetanaerobacterium elongatum TaxID=258515 RepID=A0A1G9X9X8_9FIRM|nr:tRNA (N6-threonylcarbamoyladenosine(37)-N6)-methyltransferase TrmO [Acetanaerobacterium elongatum]SDM93544.1 tRNA-Thr(GGU) m(6)t(6)A37 methyltransferase TsaA [Acetanaerobacterium elongatum]
MTISFEPIGYVENKVTEKKDTRWGEDISRLVINQELSRGLTGLDGFSHLIVLTYLNEAKFEPQRHLVRHPQGREELPMVGIFSQRAKDRPNPIGITAVEILSVEKNIVTVKGLDAIDGTPILDIKPYFPQFDCRGNAKTPEWVEVIMREYF